MENSETSQPLQSTQKYPTITSTQSTIFSSDIEEFKTNTNENTISYTNTKQPLKILQQTCINECSSPEILPYQYKVITFTQNILQSSQPTRLTPIQNHIYSMLIDRITYILSKYLRTRLYKLQLYTHSVNLSKKYIQFLSEHEKDFLQKYQ